MIIYPQIQAPSSNRWLQWLRTSKTPLRLVQFMRTRDAGPNSFQETVQGQGNQPADMQRRVGIVVPNFGEGLSSRNNNNYNENENDRLDYYG